jgi:hypothetical protein
MIFVTGPTGVLSEYGTATRGDGEIVVLSVGSPYEKLFLVVAGLDESRSGKKTFFVTMDDYVAYLEHRGRPVDAGMDGLRRQQLNLELHDRRRALLGMGLSVSP